MFMVSKESQYLCAMVHKETSGGGNQYDKPQELGPSYYCKASDKVARGDRLTGVWLAGIAVRVCTLVDTARRRAP